MVADKKKKLEKLIKENNKLKEGEGKITITPEIAQARENRWQEIDTLQKDIEAEEKKEDIKK